jgi:leucyl aminopeptidase (aminopeptidase T)
MNLRDLKSLNSTISEVAKPETQDKSRMIQEGFGNSLSAKARQVVAEQVEGSRGPNPKVPVKKVKDATGSVGIEAERIKRDGQAEMKKMMAKALNRAKKKARLVKEEEEIELAEAKKKYDLVLNDLKSSIDEKKLAQLEYNNAVLKTNTEYSEKEAALISKDEKDFLELRNQYLKYDE